MSTSKEKELDGHAYSDLLIIRDGLFAKHSKTAHDSVLPSPSQVLLARWAEWYNPSECQKKKNAGDQEDCRRHHKGTLVAYSVLAVGGLCGLLLAILHCFTCIRRKGVMSNDLKTIMTEQMQSSAPKITPPISHIRTDGFIATEEVDSDATSKRDTNNPTKMQLDIEGTARRIQDSSGRSLGGGIDGWITQIFRNHTKAVSKILTIYFTSEL